MSTRHVASLTLLAASLGACRARDARAPIAGSSLVSQVDHAREVVGVPSFVARGGRDGEGVTIAVIDTGFDVRHPALRARARWVLDQRGAPRGSHASLEARFHGAVWSADELALALAREQSSGTIDATVPEDREGHGTFVASVAAGSDGESSFEGLAPGATLVLARVGGPEGIQDRAILDALDFAIDRAAGAPLIVLLAAGSTDGAHDGTSALEAAIDQRFYRQSQRVIVIAAGNEGGASTHRRAYIRRDQRAVRLGFAVLASDRASTRSFTVTHEGALDFALEGPSGERTRWVSLGEHPGAQLGAVRVGIDRAQRDEGSRERALRPGTGARTTVITLQSERAQGEQRWSLLARGEAVVDLYSTADFVRFDGGDDRGSLVVPATAESAIVVSALITRDAWPSPDGPRSEPIAQREDGVARFASLGPDRVHRPRPDLSAPGGWLIGARSAQCDPTARGSLCPSARFTRSRLTIAAAGTSVAAPIAAGALARLWSTTRSLDRDALVSRITAASDRWSASRGWGAINLGAALAAGSATPTRCTLVAATERVVAGEPVTLAMRVWGDSSAISQPAAISIEVDAAVSTEVFSGGRALVHVRTAPRHAGARLTVTARASATVMCSASVAVDSVFDRAEPTVTGCSIASTHNQDTRQISIWVALATLIARGVRRRRCSATS